MKGCVWKWTGWLVTFGARSPCFRLAFATQWAALAAVCPSLPLRADISQPWIWGLENNGVILGLRLMSFHSGACLSHPGEYWGLSELQALSSVGSCRQGTWGCMLQCKWAWLARSGGGIRWTRQTWACPTCRSCAVYCARWLNFLFPRPLFLQKASHQVEEAVLMPVSPKEVPAALRFN